VQNCSAIPENLLESELFGYRKGAFTGADHDKVGLFEAADGGSIFLDEIGDMAMGLQAKILRVLQSSEIKPLGSTITRKVDVRIIAATNRNLNESIQQGGFRGDLFYRLNVLPLELPPIRLRKDDVPLLLSHFMKYYSPGPDAPVRNISPEAMETLVKYPWPGNIREIENLAKYLLTVTDGSIEFGDLPPPYNAEPAPEPAFRPPAAPGAISSAEPSAAGAPTMEEMERDYILSVLEKTKWNVAAAARNAGIKRTTFNSRMKKHGISKKI
jgi:transcriptional regulator with GAF, ATPase, and Fis domain